MGGRGSKSSGGGGGGMASATAANYEDIPLSERLLLANRRDVYNQMHNDLDDISSGTAQFRSVSGKLTPDNIARITDNAREEIKLYDTYLAGNNVTALNNYVNRWERHLISSKQQKEISNLDANRIDGLMRDNIRKMVYQEVESNRVQFTDHGIRHITGNIQTQNRILDIMEQKGYKVTARDRLIADFVMVNHDVGYTHPLIRSGGKMSIDATKDHKVFSEKVAREQTTTWDRGNVFTETEYRRALRIIKTHDSTTLSTRDPVALATRIADNTSMFAFQKLPNAFARVPESRDLLMKMKRAADTGDKTAFEQSRTLLTAATDRTNLDTNLKRDLRSAISDINYLTPKFSLGTLAGRTTGIEGNGSALINMKISHNSFDQVLANSFNMGQRQTKKLLEDYGITDFTKDTYQLGDLKGKPILSIDITRS